MDIVKPQKIDLVSQRLLGSIKRDKGWLIFAITSALVDSLIITPLLIDKGFAEKGLVMSLALPVNYYLAVFITTLATISMLIFLAYRNFRAGLVICSIIIYSNTLLNGYLLALYYKGLVLAW